MTIEAVRNFHAVVFIGVILVVLTMAHVCPYSDPRCKCDPPSLTCYDMDEIPPLNMGVNVSPIKDLSFEAGHIALVSNNSLPPGLSSIYFYHHPLNDISEDAFDTSAATLTSVSIIGGQFTNFPTALKKLTKLKDLGLIDTPIKDWDLTTLKLLAASLESLELSNVGLSAWPSWISDFHLLHTIDLNMNTLKAIPDDAFNFVEDTLTYLDLSKTGLTQVPQALSSLSCLETLHLRYSSLTDASEIDTITGAPFASKLSFLDLNSVGLTRAANLSNLTSLRILNLSGNRISDVPTGSLPTSLTILHIANNSLSNLPKDVAFMYRLVNLEVTRNFVTRIESNSFPSSLIYLYLDFNKLTVITNTTFRHLNLLRTLDLSFNPISVIDPEAFSDLVSLETLFFLNSQLTEFPLTFTHFNSQTEIYWSTSKPLSCPCPTPSNLVQWYTWLEKTREIEATCRNNRSINSYLRGHCVQTPATD